MAGWCVLPLRPQCGADTPVHNRGCQRHLGTVESAPPSPREGRGSIQSIGERECDLFPELLTLLRIESVLDGERRDCAVHDIDDLSSLILADLEVQLLG